MVFLFSLQVSTCLSFTANSTGGEYSHELSIPEMPKHSHEEILYFLKMGEARAVGKYTNENVGGYKIPDIAWGRSSMESQYTSTSGDNLRHNNIQPYIVTYMWRRTA